MAVGGALAPERVPAIWDRPIGRVCLWLGLAIAFSPVLLDLLRHVVANPWARTALIFPLLAAVAARHDRRVGPLPRSRRLVWIALGLALALELVATAAGVVRLGRVGLFLGAAGLLVGAGWARPASGLVLLWAIPLPSLLLDLFSPGLESLMAGAVALAVPGVDFARIAGEPSWIGPGARMRLWPTDGGLPMAFAMAGLGWFRGATIGRAPSRALSGALRWGLLALPLQGILLGFGCIAFGLGFPEPAIRLALDQVGWLLVLAAGAGLAAVSERPGRRFGRTGREERR